MKSLNLTGSQAEIVIKSLNERLYEFDEELDALESRIIEIRMKKSQLNNLLVELGGTPLSVSEAGPKKRGRKPGSGKKAEVSGEPKKRGRKPGSGKKAAVKAPAGPKKHGPKVQAKTEATPAKADSPVKQAAKKQAAKTAPKPSSTAPRKKAVPKTPAKKGETGGKRGRKSGGENTLAAKIVAAINEAQRGLSTREIVDALNSRYGAEKDERKLIQAVSSTLISLTKRGKIKRETGKDGQILNIVIS